jgi:hypothetical protein
MKINRLEKLRKKWQRICKNQPIHEQNNGQKDQENPKEHKEACQRGSFTFEGRQEARQGLRLWR